MSMQPPHEPHEPLGDGDHAEVAARLHASLSGPSLDAATRARHLEAIRARVATMPTPAPAPAPAPVPAMAAAGGLARRLASTVTAAGLVAVMGATGAVAASHDALPGHRLYPVKAGIEQLVLAAPLPTGHAVDRHLTYAERRLEEATTLVERDADPTLVADALDAHTRLLSRAGQLAGDDTELAARVDTAAAAAHRRLVRLLDQDLPAVAAQQARAALAAAQERLEHRPAVPAPPRPAPPAPDRPEDERRGTPPAPTTPPERTSPPAPASPAPATPPPDSPAPAPRPTPGPANHSGPPEQGPDRRAQQSETSPVPGPQHAPSAAQQRHDGANLQRPSAGDQAPTDGVQPNPPQPPTSPAR